MQESRRQRICNGLMLDGVGLEIGPSHNPIAPKQQGYNVRVMDHMSREGLIEKYRNHNVDINSIEKVDYIWNGEPYIDLVGHKQKFDWIIASHLIEHTPDLIAFLNDCTDVLSEDGIISLVIPDNRYCFDHFRPISSLSKVIDNHVYKAKVHSAGTVAEYFMNVVKKDGMLAWGQQQGDAQYSFVHNSQDAKRGIQSVMENNAYLDVHAWCFVPHSFRLLIRDLNELGFICIQEHSFTDTSGSEFYIQLSRQGRSLQTSRLELLKRIKIELMH